MHIDGLPASIIELDHQAHLNLVSVTHDGSLSWEDLQEVKNHIWGESAVAMEIYPAQDKKVNSGNFRHLWKLGAGDFVPDLMSNFGVLDASHGLGFEAVYRMGEALDEESLK